MKFLKWLFTAVLFCMFLVPASVEGRCDRKVYKELVGQTFTFLVGQYKTINRQDDSCSNIQVMYTGMVNHRTFSMKAPLYRSSVNLFFRADIGEFIYRDSPFNFKMKVLHVADELLTVEIVSFWED